MWFSPVLQVNFTAAISPQQPLRKGPRPLEQPEHPLPAKHDPLLAAFSSGLPEHSGLLGRRTSQTPTSQGPRSVQPIPIGLGGKVFLIGAFGPSLFMPHHLREAAAVTAAEGGAAAAPSSGPTRPRIPPG